MEYTNDIIEHLISSDVDQLKYKVIKDFDSYLSSLKQGQNLDYQHILEMISLIDIYSGLDNKQDYYKEFYLNLPDLFNEEVL